MNGKAAYQGVGTVEGFPGTAVYVYWLLPEQLWVVDFEGQPYFTSSCNTSLPPATSVASCPWTAVPGTEDCTGAAALSVSGTGTLPVNLIGFTASTIKQGVLLSWKTTAETNSRGFEIQRSTDGSNWTKIGFVNGAVNSSTEKTYRFSDGFPFSGINYYRLNQVDQDNLQKISSVASILTSSVADYYIQTNNTSSGIYQLTVRSAGPFQVSVLDMGGRRLLQTTAGQGIHQLDISRHAPGIYLLQLKQNNTIITEKLVKK